MRTNKDGISIIKNFEGLRLNAYKDVRGKVTIGWGHTGDVKMGDRITLHQAEAILDTDLDKFERGVGELVMGANENQFSAMVSLAFNIGLERFRTSQLLRLFNDGHHTRAGAEFMKWRLSAGKVYAGLVARRAAERALFMRPVQHASS